MSSRSRQKRVWASRLSMPTGWQRIADIRLNIKPSSSHNGAGPSHYALLPLKKLTETCQRSSGCIGSGIYRASLRGSVCRGNWDRLAVTTCSLQCPSSWQVLIFSTACSHKVYTRNGKTQHQARCWSGRFRKTRFWNSKFETNAILLVYMTRLLRSLSTAPCIFVFGC